MKDAKTLELGSVMRESGLLLGSGLGLEENKALPTSSSTNSNLPSSSSTNSNTQSSSSSSRRVLFSKKR